MTAKQSIKRLCLVGSTGLIGSTLLERAVARQDVRLVGIARREVPLPRGARMEMLIADPDHWSDAIAAANAQVLVCALGTTMRKVQGDEAAFRAIDHDLVLACAHAAKQAGIGHAIVVSSVGASRSSEKVYLRVKGEMEAAIAKVGLRRLDLLRPGPLTGSRRESRALDWAARRLGPVINPFLLGNLRRYRSIGAAVVADAIFALAHERAAGRFVHEYEAMRYAIRRSGD